MESVQVSKDERQSLAGATERAKKVRQTWAQDGHAIMRQYGGRWVAFVEGQVAADGASPQALTRKMASQGLEPATTVVRYVPRPTDRYVL